VTSSEIAKLLETFRRRFTPDAALVAPEVVALWNEQFRDTHRDVMRVASKAYLADPPAEGFPKPAALRWFIREASEPAEAATGASQSKPRAKPATRNEPHGCDRGWSTSTQEETGVASRPTLDEKTKKLDGPSESYTFTYPPGLLPCAVCNPAGHERWRTQWVPEGNRMRPVKSTDLFDFDPTEKLLEARSLVNVTKDPADL
jgi:hypothetical protein